MSRYIICDVCEQNFEQDDPVAQMIVPAEWLGTAVGVTVDVCSPSCLTTLSMRLSGSRTAPFVTGEQPDQGDDEGEPQPVPEPMRFAPEEPEPVSSGFLSPVKVKTKGER